MMPAPLDLPALARLHVLERTALPAEAVDRVLAALHEFWCERFPDLAAAAADLVTEAEEER